MTFLSLSLDSFNFDLTFSYSTLLFINNIQSYLLLNIILLKLLYFISLIFFSLILISLIFQSNLFLVQRFLFLLILQTSFFRPIFLDTLTILPLKHLPITNPSLVLTLTLPSSHIIILLFFLILIITLLLLFFLSPVFLNLFKGFLSSLFLLQQLRLLILLFSLRLSSYHLHIDLQIINIVPISDKFLH